MKCLVIIALIVLFAENSYAQNDTLSRKETRQQKKQLCAATNDVYRSTSLAFSQTKIQDTRMSPLIYAGLGITANFNRLRYGKKSLGEWSFNLGYHGVRNTPGSWSLMHLAKLDLNYQYQRKVRNRWGLLYVGAGIQNQLNSRVYSPLGNNAFATDYSLAFSPGVTFIKEKFCKDKWGFIGKVNFALAALTVRFPQFTYDGIETQFLSIGYYNKWQMELGLIKKLKYSAENKFYLAYCLDFYSFGSSVDQKRVGQYINTLKVAFWLKTK